MTYNYLTRCRLQDAALLRAKYKVLYPGRDGAHTYFSTTILHIAQPLPG